MNRTTTFNGTLSADGTIASCANCTLNGIVNFRTLGIHDPKIMALVVLKSMIALLILIVSIYRVYKVQLVWFVMDTTKLFQIDRGYGHSFQKAVFFVTAASAIQVATIATREASPQLKGSFLFIYPVYTLCNLAAEYQLAVVLNDSLVARFFRLYGRQRLELAGEMRSDLRSIQGTCFTIAGLVVLLRTGFVLAETIKLLGYASDQISLTVVRFALKVLAVAAKSFYTLLGFIFVFVVTKLQRGFRSADIECKPLHYHMVVMLLYLIWAACALIVFASRAYAYKLDGYNADLVGLFTYDLPYLLILVFLGRAIKSRGEYTYDEHGPVKEREQGVGEVQEVDQHTPWDKFGGNVRERERGLW